MPFVERLAVPSGKQFASPVAGVTLFLCKAVEYGVRL